MTPETKPAGVLLGDQGAYCCVCHIHVPSQDVRSLGGRSFCERHYHLALDATEPSFWRMGIIESLLLAGFVGLCAFLFRDGQIEATLPIAVIMSVIPALLFSIYIYRQDRVEPEPITMVAGVFFLGALMGAGIVDPLTISIAGSDLWSDPPSGSSFFLTVGTTGILTALSTYLVVRYTVYLTDEFDEPVDGVIYGAAASLGLATAMNVDFVTSHRDIVPVAVASTISAMTLAHVALGVAVGLGLGHARFVARRAQLWLFGACFFGAIFHGTIHELLVLAGATRGNFRPFTTFVIVLVLGLIVLISAHYATMRFARALLEGEGLEDAVKGES